MSTTQPIASKAVGIGQTEVQRASRNAAKLFGSLAVTLCVAFAVRFWLPRHLGPESFGVLHFAQEFSAALFVLLNLGAETYIAKEVAVRPRHASDFFGGLLLVRLVLGILLSGAMFGLLLAMNKGPGEVLLVSTFAVGQLFFVIGHSFAALLQANTTVSELAVINSVSKILWGSIIVVGVLSGGDLMVVAVSFLATEALKCLALFWVCRQRTGLRLSPDIRAVAPVLLVSLPFFINYVAHRVAGNIDVTMISTLINDAEVGWYGAAINVTMLIFLVLPVLNAVLLPMSARIASRAPEELAAVMRGAVRMIFVVTLPMAALVVVNGNDIVALLFGGGFSPTALSLSILGPLVPITYLCVLASAYLIQLGRAWTVAKISLATLLLNPLLNYLLLEEGHARLGPGGAGYVAASTTVVSELLAAVLMFWALAAMGHRLFNRELVLFVARMAVPVAAVVVVHLLIAAGWLRLALEPLVYVGVAVPMKVLPWRALISAVRGGRS